MPCRRLASHRRQHEACMASIPTAPLERGPLAEVMGVAPVRPTDAAAYENIRTSMVRDSGLIECYIEKIRILPNGVVYAAVSPSSLLENRFESGARKAFSTGCSV